MVAGAKQFRVLEEGAVLHGDVEAREVLVDDEASAHVLVTDL